MKKITKMVAATLAACMLVTTMNVPAKADEYTHDMGTVVFGTTMVSLATDEYDKYKLVVPAKGIVNMYSYAYVDEDVYYEVYNSRKSEVDDGYLSMENSTASNQVKKSLSLDAGTYYVYIMKRYSNDFEYYCTFDYDFRSSTNAVIKSYKKGNLKVVAPAGAKNNGFQIAYRVKGTKKWTYKNVATKNNLNTTIKKLKSKKKYQVTVRKYVYDENNLLYWSKWSKVQTITVK